MHNTGTKAIAISVAAKASAMPRIGKMGRCAFSDTLAAKRANQVTQII